MDFNGQKVDYSLINYFIQNNVSESQELEFKGKGQIIGNENETEFGVEISAMANTGGGLIIYGIKSERRKISGGPAEEDFAAKKDPFDSTDFSYVSFKDKLKNRIEPTPVLELLKIDDEEDKSKFYFAVQVKESFRLPHMFVSSKSKKSPSHKYYFRQFDGSSEPLTDYFVRKLIESQQQSPLSVNLLYSFVNVNQLNFDFKVENIGKRMVESIKVRIITPSEFNSPYQQKWEMRHRIDLEATQFDYYEELPYFTRSPNELQRFTIQDTRLSNFDGIAVVLFLEIQGKNAIPYYGKVLVIEPKFNQRFIQTEVQPISYEEFNEEVEKTFKKS